MNTNRTHLLLLPLGAAALALSGCGGGSGGGPGPGSTDSLAAGRAALNNLASGAQTTTTSSLTSALTLFQQAVKNDPSNSTARFGEAIAMAGVCTDLMDGATTTVTPVAGGGSAGSGSGVGFIGGPPAPPTSKAAKANTRDAVGTGSGSSGGGIVPPPPTNGDIPPTPPGVTTTPAPVPAHHTLGLIWFLDRGLSNPYTLLETLAPVTDLHLGLLPFSGYSQDATDIARREKLLTQLGTVLSDLAVVEADPSFTYTLPAPDQNGKTVTIGLPEVYLFDAYVNSLSTQVALSLAYVRDPGTWQPVLGGTGSSGSSGSGSVPPPPAFSNRGKSPEPIFLSYAALDTNADGKLEPNEYLPPSPYLTLRDASFLKTAQTSLAATAAKETLGITGVLARPADGSFLVPNTAQVAAILNNISTNVVPLLAQAAVGPVTLTFPHYAVYNLVGTVTEGVDNSGGVFQSVSTSASSGTSTTTIAPSGGAANGVNIPTVPPGITVSVEQVTVNLTAWFNTPPADLKAFAPTYTLTADGWIAANGAVYPDSTFGGLFPNGLPQDLLL